MKRRKQKFSYYEQRNMLSPNIAASFGDVGLELAKENLFSLPSGKGLLSLGSQPNRRSKKSRGR